tara:strand:+ start:3761 stop:4249 length:489 start_codon:yes stop_codon:yes gene_type:complete
VYAYSSLDVLQTEEIKKYHFNLQKMGFNLSLCKCISCRKGIAPLMMRSDPLPMKLDKIIEEDKMENIIKENKDLSGGMYVFLSVMSAIGSFFFGLLSLGNALSQTGSDSAVLSLFLLSMISVIGSILLGVKAKNKGVNFWLAMLGVGISVLAVLFLFPIFFP